MTSLRLKRGTTTQINSYTGPPGELSVDTTANQLRLHDGTTAGGVAVGALTVTSIKTSDYTANVNELVRINSSAGGFTITLPASPPDGAKIQFIDVANQGGANPVLVSANGKTILGDSTGISLDVNGAGLSLMFNELTNDWSKIDMFSSSFGIVTAPSGSYIATPAVTPNIGDYFEGGYYTGMIWNQLTQSLTSITLTSGSKTFIVPDMTSSPIVYVGQTLEIRSRDNLDNKFIGIVTNASDTELTINCTFVGSGTGTRNDWSIMAKYRILVSPKAFGLSNYISLKNTNTALPYDSQTLTEGWISTNAMKNEGDASIYPAAWWARGLQINGYNDWYIPARDELELCYRNLKPTTESNDTNNNRLLGNFNYAKNGSYGNQAIEQGTNFNSSPAGIAYTEGSPTQTGILLFRTGNSESFSSASFWSSSEFDYLGAWGQYYRFGTQSNYSKSDTLFIRAIRRSII